MSPRISVLGCSILVLTLSHPPTQVDSGRTVHRLGTTALMAFDGETHSQG
jgi:hypothetical protein